MSDLADFLLARIADDEAAAREAVILDRAYPDGYEISYTWMRQVYEVATGTTSSTNVLDVRAPSPDRVLAECDAKRRIVAWHRLIDGLDSDDNPVRGCGNCIASGAEPPYIVAGPCMTVRLLALPYADHPDYLEEWRP